MDTVMFAKNTKAEIVAEGVSRKILTYNKTIMGVEVHFETGAIGAEHSHPHSQLTYVLEGSFEFTVDGKQVCVSKGDSLVFEPQVRHGALCTEKGVVLDIFTPYREDFIEKK